MNAISKPYSISEVQYIKKLHFDFYKSDLKIAVDEATRHVFNMGHKIGGVPQNIFPNESDSTPENFTDFTQSISNLNYELKMVSLQEVA